MPIPEHECPNCNTGWNGRDRKCPNGHELPSEERQLWKADVRKEGTRFRIEISTPLAGTLMFHSVADQHDVRRFIRHDLRPRWSGKLGTKPTEGENADDAQRLGFERIDSEGGASFTVPNRSFDELDQAFRVWREKIQKR